MSLFENTIKPIGLASDHAGYAAKQIVIKLLTEKVITFKDFGTYSDESSDMPIMLIRWQKPSRARSVIRESPFMAPATV